MLIRRNVRTLLAGAALAVSSMAGAAGCGGLGAGDYEVYRVAYDAVTTDASCYADNMIPEDKKDDTTTFRSGSTFILYVDGGDLPLLDTGDLVLEGSKTDNGYTFSGDQVDITYPPGMTIIDADHDGIDDQMDNAVDADGDGQDDKTMDPEVDTDMDGLDDRFEDDLVDANNDGIDDWIVKIPSGLKYIATATVTIDMTVDGDTISGTVKSVTEQKCEGATCPTDFAKSCTRTGGYKGVKLDDANVSLKSGTSTQSGTP